MCVVRKKFSNFDFFFTLRPLFFHSSFYEVLRIEVFASRAGAGGANFAAPPQPSPPARTPFSAQFGRPALDHIFFFFTNARSYDTTLHICRGLSQLNSLSDPRPLSSPSLWMRLPIFSLVGAQRPSIRAATLRERQDSEEEPWCIVDPSPSKDQLKSVDAVSDTPLCSVCS